jgi:hypothetical protein
MRSKKVRQHLLRAEELAVIELLSCWLLLMTSPQVQQRLAPFFRGALFQGILTFSDRHPCRFEPGFQGVELDGFPELEVHRIVGLISPVMPLDEIMGPHLTALGRVIQRGDVIKMLTIGGQQGLIDAQYTLSLHRGSSKTGQEG